MAKKNGGKVVLWSVICVAAAGLIGSGVWLYSETKDYVSGGNEYSNLASSYTAGGTVKKSGLFDTIGTWLGSKDNGDEANIDAIMEAQEIAAMDSTAAPVDPLAGTVPDVGAQTPEGAADTLVKPTLSVDFTALGEVNKDIIGWIYAKDTVISYPILQGDDNNTYLRRLYDGSANKVGSIFLDVAAAPDFTDTNSVLYGHHMRDGSMFASIVGYKQQEYYDEHPTMELYTPTGNYVVELFSGYITNATADQGCYRAIYETPEDYLDFIAEAKGKSTFKADVEVGQTDRIITLSTCTYETSNARYVVIGKLTPMTPAEETQPATSEA